MRIITGDFRGRTFHPPKGLPVRPTTDQAKEALFNILAHRLDWEDVTALDLFSGTGNMAYECLSRGSQRVVCVDQHPGCTEFIRKTLFELGCTEKAEVIKMDAKAFLKKTEAKFDLIFMDPPYAMPGQEELIRYCFDRKILLPEGILILEHATQANYGNLPEFWERRAYGGSTFSLFVWKENS